MKNFPILSKTLGYNLQVRWNEKESLKSIFPNFPFISGNRPADDPAWEAIRKKKCDYNILAGWEYLPLSYVIQNHKNARIWFLHNNKVAAIWYTAAKCYDLIWSS